MKHVTKRLLAVMLALVLCLSLLPGIAMAADAYVKVTSVSDITSGGQFVFVADGYAMTTTLMSNSKFSGAAVSPSGNTLSGSSLPVWTVEAVSGGIAISVDGQYLGYNSSTNFKMQDTAYTWTVTAGDSGFIIKSAAATTRGIFLQTSSSRFGAYSTTNTSGYVFELQLYKLSDGEPGCAHAYTSEVTAAATCTEDGVETFTCGLCGDSYTKGIPATGHNYVDGTCTGCGDVKLLPSTDAAKILTEAYALAAGESLGYEATLTGKIISIKDPYNTSYKNISVIIEVPGYADMPMLCYRLAGEGADKLLVDDTITVTGTITNYNGTIEFAQGCTLDQVVSGGGTAPVAPSDPKQIVADAYALAEGATLPYTATLTGVITEVGAYNETYGDITVYMVVEGKEFQCYALKGEGVADLAVGDTITVTGAIKNYYGTIEFDKPTLDKVVKGDGSEDDDSAAEIVDAAYALATDTALEGTYTLTGIITSIDTPYSTQYNNITVTIAVKGKEDKPIQCFRLKGDNADMLKSGDTITVTGTLSNYRGTVQFSSGCTLDKWIEGEGEDIVVPTDPKEIVDAAYALAPGAVLPYEATLTGKVTEIVDAYSEQYSNITVNMVIEGREDKPILCYRMKGEGADTLAVGDTITVTGNLKNYTKTDSETGITTNTIEFTPCALDAVVKGSAAVTVSGTVETGNEGDATIELIAEGQVIATVTASGTYSIEDVAAGTYTLKVSKANHVTREYTVTVADAALTQDVKIHLIGDIDGNGKINMGDVGRINSHVKGINVLTDEYQILCANINGGSLNMGDTAALYAHVKGSKLLY